jgi:hypothetical protein
LLSPRWLRLVYSRPLLAAVPENLGEELRRRLERGWARHANATNPYAWALLAGEAPFEAPCHGGLVEFVHADAAAYLERCPAGSFDGFTLSNILDGASADYADRLRRAMRRAARPGAVMVLRSFTGSSDLAAEDRSLLWGSVAVSSVR